MLDRLSQKLGYTFKNPSLLEAALTHRSLRGKNNERLEYLGDSILNFLVAEAIFQRCPHAREGEMSRLRASLVKGDTLAELALEFELGNYLRLGSGELKSGGYKRASILADAVEAIIAAIYLDSNINIVKQRVLHWYGHRLDQLSKSDATKDPKTCLQEYLQSQHVDLPHYDILEVGGEAHAQVFTVNCIVDALHLSAEGSGSSRRKAEQDAAEKILHLLGQRSS